MNKKLLGPYGLKWNPFSPDVPVEALHVRPPVDSFCWRVENLAREGGFALVAGEPGTGKSVVLRLVAARLARVRDVQVGILSRPQSALSDFYREMGDLFGVELSPHNRWAGTKVLRERWRAHLEASLSRPVLIVDEAQEMQPAVLNELRLLASVELDSRMLLSVVLAGDMFNLYVFIEVAAIASYGLVAFGTEREELEAAFKYLVLGVLASACPDARKTVVIGRGFTNAAEVEAAADTRTDLVAAPDAEGMKQAMLGCDAAVSACGQTLYELARVGVPTVGIGVAANQRQNIRGWRDTGFLAYAGDHDAPDLEARLDETVRSLPPERRAAMIRAGRACVDGRGARRVVAAVLEGAVT